MKRTFIFAGVLVVFLILKTSADAATCEQLFRVGAPSKRSELARIAGNVEAYRKSINAQILEREFVIEPFLISLVAREHMLLIGPPGNAKTTLAKLLMTNIVDRGTRQPSFFSMQMHKEITLSDTHGGLDFGKLSHGIVERQYHEGMLGAKLGFMDEAFDVRAGALRNSLDVLAERAHSQGTQHHKGLTQTVIAASNKTLGEVYEDFNNSEQPRAFTDRFAFVLFVPKEMHLRESDRQIFKGANTEKPPIHKLEFQDLDVISDLADKVETPEYIADLASIIHYRLSPEFEAREVKAMELYRESIRSGKYALPPYRAAKYPSPRTLSKAGAVLRAIVALDYVAKRGERELTATTEDLAKLKTFYQLNGPSDRVLETQLSRAVKEFEKDQIASVKIDRAIVNPLFDSTIKEFNQALGQLKLHELDQAVREYSVLGTDARRRLTDQLKDMYQTSLATMQLELKTDITSETIASNAANEIVKDYVEQLWPGRSDAIAKKWTSEIGIDKAALTQKQRNRRAHRLKSHADVAARPQGRLPRDVAKQNGISRSTAVAPEISKLPEIPSTAAAQQSVAAYADAPIRFPAPFSKLTGIVANYTGDKYITTSNDNFSDSTHRLFSSVPQHPSERAKFSHFVPLGPSILAIGPTTMFRINSGLTRERNPGSSIVASDGQTVFILHPEKKIVWSSGGEFNDFGAAFEAHENPTAASAILGDTKIVGGAYGLAVAFQRDGHPYLRRMISQWDGVRHKDFDFMEVGASNETHLKMINRGEGFIVGKDKLTAFKLNGDGVGGLYWNSSPIEMQTISISANGLYMAYVSAQTIRLYRTSDVHHSVLHADEKIIAPLIEVQHDMPEVSAITMSGDGSTAFLYDTHSVLKFKFHLPEEETATK